VSGVKRFGELKLTGGSGYKRHSLKDLQKTTTTKETNTTAKISLSHLKQALCLFSEEKEHQRFFPVPGAVS
jgi:hypothetical protein